VLSPLTASSSSCEPAAIVEAAGQYFPWLDMQTILRDLREFVITFSERGRIVSC
jgi:hypothetical protein